MKKLYFVLFIGLIAISCSKEEKTFSIKKSDRLSFQDMQEFNATYQMLSKMTSEEDLYFWAQSKDHSTLLYSEDTTIRKYSYVLQTILNKDSEYELGNSIIWFNKGNFYSIPKNEESMINILKKSPDKLNIMGVVKLRKVKIVDLKYSNYQFYTPLGYRALDARNQYTFAQQTYQSCGGSFITDVGGRKYVHEIYDESIPCPIPSRFNAYLHLRIKLEYRTNGTWKAASEQRQISVNVTGTAVLNSGPGPGLEFNFAIPYTYFDCSGNRDFTIVTKENAFLDENPHWLIMMTGSIYQKIKGDNTANAWTNTQNPNNPGRLW